MNDNTKVLDQNPGTPPTPVQPFAPVGIANKEMGPIGIAEIRPAGPEVNHRISQELKELGVEEKRDAPDLTFEHNQIGLEHSGATSPVPTGPTGLIKISEKRDTNINNSSTWYDWLLEKVDKVMKLKLLGG